MPPTRFGVAAPELPDLADRSVLDRKSKWWQNTQSTDKHGDPQVTKQDPKDLKSCTLRELHVKYKGAKTEEEVLAYWSNVMKDDERRIDSFDNKIYTFRSLEEKYLGQYTAAQLKDYWQTHCRKTDQRREKQIKPPPGASARPWADPFAEKRPFPTEEEQKAAHKKEDPNDHKYITWAECQEKYKGIHTDDDIRHYFWRVCRWVENKIDPDDNEMYVLMDLHEKYTKSKFFSGNDTFNYFKDECIAMVEPDEPPPPKRFPVVPPGWKPPSERREDPDDRRTYNFDQIQARYKGKYPAEELRKYWDHNCRWIEARVDPDDRCAYTLMELHDKYTHPGHFAAGETVHYFQNDCFDLEKWLKDYEKKAPYTQDNFELPQAPRR